MTTPLLDQRRVKAAVGDWLRQSGQRLHARRRLLGLTQQQLADLAGIRATSVSRLELGLAIPREGVRLSIAFALACNVVDIWPPMDREHIAMVARAA